LFSLNLETETSSGERGVIKTCRGQF